MTRVELTEPLPPYVRRAINAVSEQLRVNPEEVMRGSRDRNTVLVRHVVAYAIRHALGRSFPGVAKEVGFSDHTSAMHAVKKVKAMIDNESAQGLPVHARTLVAIAARAMGAVPPRDLSAPPADWWEKQCQESEVRRDSSE